MSKPKTVQVSLDLPQSFFSALRQDPATFVGEMRLAAAVKWYEMDEASQAKAAGSPGCYGARVQSHGCASTCGTMDRKHPLFRAHAIQRMFERGQTVAVFRDVPAQVCANYGETYVSEEITAQLLEEAEEAVQARVQADVREVAPSPA